MKQMQRFLFEILVPSFSLFLQNVGTFFLSLSNINFGCLSQFFKQEFSFDDELIIHCYWHVFKFQMKRSIVALSQGYSYRLSFDTQEYNRCHEMAIEFCPSRKLICMCIGGKFPGPWSKSIQFRLPQPGLPIPSHILTWSRGTRSTGPLFGLGSRRKGSEGSLPDSNGFKLLTKMHYHVFFRNFQKIMVKFQKLSKIAKILQIFIII